MIEDRHIGNATTLAILKNGCAWEGQIGATVRNGNDWWREVCGTVTTAAGDNVPTVVIHNVDVMT